MPVLVGDIGGTKTSLALARDEGATIVLDAQRRFPSREFPSLEQCVTRYLDALGRPALELGAFAVAGPIQGDRCATTNLAWTVDARTLERELGLRRAVLLNDLEAVAWAVPALSPEQIAVLQPGDGSSGNACVVAAGTGLGEAGMFWDGARHHPFGTEGGHTDFAPQTELELELLRFLLRRHQRVSWERVVSGMGIANVHAFLLEHHGAATPAWRRDAADIPAAVAERAADRSCPICVETMTLVFELYGCEAGNLALDLMALGGVWLAGGVVQRNLEQLRAGDFLERFANKGRMRPLMQRMPVRAILDPHAGLRGAARCCAARVG